MNKTKILRVAIPLAFIAVGILLLRYTDGNKFALPVLLVGMVAFALVYPRKPKRHIGGKTVILPWRRPKRYIGGTRSTIRFSWKKNLIWIVPIVIYLVLIFKPYNWFG
jgi:hypothetical protein